MPECVSSDTAMHTNRGYGQLRLRLWAMAIGYATSRDTNVSRDSYQLSNTNGNLSLYIHARGQQLTETENNKVLLHVAQRGALSVVGHGG